MEIYNSLDPKKHIGHRDADGYAIKRIIWVEQPKDDTVFYMTNAFYINTTDGIQNASFFLYSITSSVTWCFLSVRWVCVYLRFGCSVSHIKFWMIAHDNLTTTSSDAQIYGWLLVAWYTNNTHIYPHKKICWWVLLSPEWIRIPSVSQCETSKWIHITMFMNVRVSHNLSFAYTILMPANNFGSFWGSCWTRAWHCVLLSLFFIYLFRMFITLRQFVSDFIRTFTSNEMAEFFCRDDFVWLWSSYRCINGATPSWMIKAPFSRYGFRRNNFRTSWNVTFTTSFQYSLCFLSTKKHLARTSIMSVRCALVVVMSQ